MRSAERFAAIAELTLELTQYRTTSRCAWFSLTSSSSVSRQAHLRLLWRNSVDEPFMWGCLPLRTFLDSQTLRWTLGASDVMFNVRSYPPPSARRGGEG